MSWEATRLGDIIEFSNGVNFDKSLYAPGIKLVNVSNFGDRLYPDYSELAEISEDVVKENDYLQNGDIIFVRSNGNKELVGRCMLIENPPMRTTYSGFCIRARIKNRELFDSKFLTYHFKSGGFRTAMAGNAVGANIQNLSQGRLSAYTAYIPSIETQRRIADILSAYDDLIENNRKQIKLLEEAAQRLYKEWFVDLRFPGHEHTKIMDGVPEGWERAHLSDIADINANNIPKNYCFNYIEYTDLSAVQNGIIREKTRYALNEAPGRAKRMANDGDIIWGMVRPNLKSFALVLHPTETDVFSTGFCVLSAKKVPFTYLYYAVTTESFIKYLVNCTNGAAYPAVKPIHFSEAEIILPHEKILKRFNIVVEPMLRKREKLLLIINQASQARDRLLPKLMSGEVKV